MSTSTLKARAADELDSVADAIFREEFLGAVSHVGLGQDQAVALVEASTGRPYAVCGAADLLPILGDLLALVRRTSSTVNAESACNM
ncbi:MAG: hypothetical protein ACR2IK_22310 [Chloroflexota bacterium]